LRALDELYDIVTGELQAMQKIRAEFQGKSAKLRKKETPAKTITRELKYYLKPS
jgi:septation ring formation regulator EzrA